MLTITVLVFFIGFGGGIFTWLALRAVDSNNVISDNTNQHLLLFQQIGCGIDCIRTIQSVCIFLVIVGIIGIIYYRRKNNN